MTIHAPRALTRTLIAGTLFAVPLAGARVARAQWPADYAIEPIGFYGPFYSDTFAILKNEAGQIAAYTYRISATGGANGRSTWVWTPQLGTVRTGVIDAAHTGSAGYQYHVNSGQNNAGQVIGWSQRITGTTTLNGANTWVWTAASGTVTTGLVDAAHTRSTGQQVSNNNFQSESGQVAGNSTRYTGSASNGRNTWVWTSATGTVTTGLVDAAHTGNAGYQSSTNVAQNEAGQITGHSQRITGVNTGNGQNAWVWAPATGDTVVAGLTGAEHTGSDGYQYSVIEHMASTGGTGRVAGYAQRISGVSAVNGQNTWVWTPAAGSVVTGLTDGAHTGSSGFQYSANTWAGGGGGGGAADSVAGYSQRISGSSTVIGQNTWVWSAAAGTVPVGLVGADQTGTAGYQDSAFDFNTEANAVGRSLRYTTGGTDNGRNSWYWSPSTGTVLIGLTGAAYTGSAGYQFSVNTAPTSSGRASGMSYRISGLESPSGQHTWIWTTQTGTVRTGLFDAEHTGFGGDQLSRNEYQNDAGAIVGYCDQYGLVGGPGRSTWVWTPTTGTVRTGLLDAPHTSSTGLRYSTNEWQGVTPSGQVFGASIRYTGTAGNGRSTWVWTADAGTQPTGLTDGPHTGSAGYRESTNEQQNAAGYIVGSTKRVSGVSTLNGSDTWLYDPATHQTHQPTLGVPGSIRTIDGYSFSETYQLLDDGTVIGAYKYFENGEGAGEDRAFIYRADRGVADLGSLVAGGLSAAGWSTLLHPSVAWGADDLERIIGLGVLAGEQVSFVMYPSNGPTACGRADVGRAGGLEGRDGTLDNNDFVVFINWFFTGDTRADTGTVGGLQGSDGQLDNNDFIVFIDQFFNGC